MKLDAMLAVILAVACVALALGSCGCTTVEPTTIIQAETGSGGAGGTGGGTETGGGGATSTASSTSTVTSTGQGGSAPETGACYGYDEGQLSACRQPLTADACAAYGWTSAPGETCPTANLVGCCYYALEYLCYYAPTFSPDIAANCGGVWEAP